MQQRDLPYQYWGKTDRNGGGSYHPLVYHSLDVAAVGYQILSRHPILSSRIAKALNLTPEEGIRVVTYLLSLHDLGKWSEGFQRQVPELFTKLFGYSPRINYPIHHTNLGLILFENKLSELIKEFPSIFTKIRGPDFRDDYKPWLFAVFGHHGIPPDTSQYTLYDLDSLFSENNCIYAEEFLKAMTEFFLTGITLPNQDAVPDFNLSSESWLIAGLTVISDWIASSELIPFTSEIFSVEEYWMRTLGYADKSLEICGLDQYLVSGKTGVTSLFPKFVEQNLALSPLQELMNTIELGEGPHLFIIEEATGGGKTEASVTLAHRLMAKGQAEGMYIGLPTMATANAMYNRMKDCYRRMYQPDCHPSLILAHGSRNLLESFRETVGPQITLPVREYLQGEETSEATCSRWLSDHRKSSLIASIGVGTIDQALAGVLPQKHQVLRIYGLAKNVLIIDEVHAYDRYMNRLLRSLLSFQAALGGSAILLSATLPENQKMKYIQSFAGQLDYSTKSCYDKSYPLVTHVSRDGQNEIRVAARAGTVRTVPVIFFDSIDVVIDTIIRELKTGKCVCWIRNTVADATDAYDVMKSRIDSDKILLFHARFAMGDRLDIEQEVIKRFGPESTAKERAGSLLIATQVVEQSLDIDFDAMITDLAPIDLIIQRLGRLHRHARSDRDQPVLGIFSPPYSPEPGEDWYSQTFPKGSFVYRDHGRLWLTDDLLRQIEHIRTDKIRDLIESVYGPDAKEIPQGLMEQLKRVEEEEKKAESLAHFRVLSVDMGYVYEDIPWGEEDVELTRLSDPTIRFCLCRWDEQEGVLIPWRSTDRNPFEMSMIQVSKRSFDIRIQETPALAQALEQISEAFRVRDIIYVPLVSDSDGSYFCHGTYPTGREAVIRYSQERGLSVWSAGNI